MIIHFPHFVGKIGAEYLQNANQYLNVQKRADNMKMIQGPKL